MLFSSIEFAIFFIIVCALYWATYKWRHVQNFILFAASMYFYAQLHYSFPIYIICMAGISYLFANIIEKKENERKRKRWLIAGICTVSLGLIYTKYSGFLLGSFRGLEQWQSTALHILTPVGISFYTFAMLGYMLEVYYENIPAERNFLTYASYISFFPHLLSGPIASSLTVLPQFSKKPVLTIASADEAIGEFIWGLFKKMVVADNISLAVSLCFSSNNSDLNGSSLYVGAVLFGVQIYADFSGYSSMARGCAKMLGIDLVQNFHTPLFSKSVSEYWRRWHISLTTWFNSYIYNPIVFSIMRWGKWSVIIGLMLTFLISGIWHGAGWQYIIFGVVNGLALVYEMLTKKLREKIFGKLPKIINTFISRFLVLNFMIFSWIFFRANSVKEAVDIISRIFSKSFFEAPTPFVLKYLVWIIPLIVIEWIQRNGTYTMDMLQWLPTKVTHKNKPQKQNLKWMHIAIKITIYVLLGISIYLFYKKQNMAEYYYFKF